MNADLAPHVHLVTYGQVWSPLVHLVTCGQGQSPQVHLVTCGHVSILQLFSKEK